MTGISLFTSYEISIDWPMGESQSDDSNRHTIDDLVFIASNG